MRADLMAQLRIMIKSRSLTQGDAARLLGVRQSRISDLVRGKWEKFSLDMLVTLALRAGMWSFGDSIFYNVINNFIKIISS